MTIYVWQDGSLIEKRHAKPAPKGPASSLPRPYIIGDGCEVQSMADGNTYTSKAAYRRSLRAQGYAEVGDDKSFHERPAPAVDLPPIEADIAQVYDELGG